MSIFENHVALIGGFKTWEEAEEHRLGLIDPDNYGILSMHTMHTNDVSLYTPALKSIINLFLED
jgi:hypothetical protein